MKLLDLLEYVFYLMRLNITPYRKICYPGFIEEGIQEMKYKALESHLNSPWQSQVEVKEANNNNCECDYESFI